MIKIKNCKDKLLKKIHINRHILQKNKKSGKFYPIITSKTSKYNIYGHRVDILDSEDNIIASVVQYTKPLKCGSICCVETKGKIRITKKSEDLFKTCRLKQK